MLLKLVKIGLFILLFNILLGTIGDSVETAQKQVNIVIKPLLPINPNNVKVVIEYFNPMTKPLTLPLPANDKEMHFFIIIELIIDGKQAEYKYYNASVDDIAFRLIKTIPPGESFDLEVDLSLIYKLPKDWKKLEITHKTYASLEITLLGSAVIERK
jgi:hypothetical protein